MYSRHIAWRITLLACTLTVGCRTVPRTTPLPPPLPRGAAIRTVNDNAVKITAALRAIGSADGQFADANGTRRSFHLDAVMFYLKPSSLRLDLKSFGERRVLLGSNADRYWFYSGEDDSYVCGTHGEAWESPVDTPVRADQMIEALGLGGVAVDGSGPVMRVDGEFQQLLFVDLDSDDGPSLAKEYWLDRRPPYLIRRVLFRDPEGVLQMESSLDDYRALNDGGPLLPYRILAAWPDKGSEMTLRISKWELLEQVRADGPQFATPPQCPDR